MKNKNGRDVGDRKKRLRWKPKFKENKDLLWRAEFCGPRHKRTKSSFYSHSVWPKAYPFQPPHSAHHTILGLTSHGAVDMTPRMAIFSPNLLIIPLPNYYICPVHLVKTPRLTWLLPTVEAAMKIAQHVFGKHFGDFEAGGRRLQKE